MKQSLTVISGIFIIYGRQINNRRISIAMKNSSKTLYAEKNSSVRMGEVLEWCHQKKGREGSKKLSPSIFKRKL
jgi:hypothetical protein